MHELLRRDVLGDSWRERGEHVCDLSEQHVFGGGGVVVQSLPGERDVGGGERVAGVLLLQGRVCACGGRVHVQGVRSGHVQQPARADGVLELLRGFILCALRRSRQRNMRELCTRTVVAGGQPEL